jgi:hypothetical protein
MEKTHLAQFKKPPNITLLFWLLNYQIVVEALVKYTYIVFRAVDITHSVCLTIYLITPESVEQFILSHVCILASQNITHLFSQLFVYHIQSPLQSFLQSLSPLAMGGINCSRKQ